MVDSSERMARNDQSSTVERLDLLGDRSARAILTAASAQPVTAKELIEHCDVSATTVYRRIKTLVEHGLLEERVTLADDSRQMTVYRTTFIHMEVAFDEGGFEVITHADEGRRFAYLLSELPFETVSVDLTERQVIAQATLDEQLVDRLGALLSTY